MEKTFQYRDKYFKIPLLLVLAFYYRHIGDRGLLIDLLKDPQYYLDIVVCIATTSLYWYITKNVIIRLDKHHPWERDLFRRLITQWGIVLGILTPIQIVIMYVYNLYIVLRPDNFDFAAVFYTDLPLVWLMFSLVQLTYAVAYYHQRHELLTKDSASPPVADLDDKPDVLFPSEPQTLLVQQGNALVPLPLADIAYIYKLNDLTFIRTTNKQDYSAESTLDKLEHILPPYLFFRLNRQMIVARQSVKQILPDTYGKLQVRLTPPFEQEAGVSRTKATDFQKWLGANLS